MCKEATKKKKNRKKERKIYTVKMGNHHKM